MIWKISSRAVAGLGLVALLSAIFLISGCGSMPENAAANVNGIIITKDDVAARIQVAAGLNPTKVPTDTESEDYRNFQRDVTAQMVSEEIERQEIEKRGITISADEISTLLQQVVEDKYLGSVQKMEEDFAKRGITDDDLRNEIWRGLAHQKLLASLRDEVSVSDAEVLAQYQSSMSNYVFPEKRQTRQIVILDEATAQSVASRLAAGEDFTTLAREISIDTKTKQNGGLLGLVTRDSLPKAVGDVAFTVDANSVSMPFQSDLGWYVVKVDFVTPPSNRTFDEVKGELTTFMNNQRLADHYKDYAEGLKSEYNIEYADDYSPRPESTDQTTSTELALP